MLLQFYPFPRVLVIFTVYVNVRGVEQLNFTLKSAFLHCRVHLGNDSANKSSRWSGTGHGTKTKWEHDAGMLASGFFTEFRDSCSIILLGKYRNTLYNYHVFTLCV